MPMIDLTYVRGSVDDRALSRLTDELVTVLLRAERAPDTPFLRDNTLVYLHALEPAELSVGGRGPGEPRFRVDLTVFEGALDKDRKERLTADVHAAVERARKVFSLYDAAGKLTLDEPQDYGRLPTATQNRAVDWLKKQLP